MIIDVSYAQSRIDWQKIAANPSIEGIIIKITGEETAGNRPFIDPMARVNVPAARATGKPVGFYHFADGGKASASGADEAAFFLETAHELGGIRPGDILPTVDVEWPPDGGHLFEIEQWAELASSIWTAIGKAPMLYRGAWYWPKIVGTEDFGWAADCPLWLASYTRECPPAFKPWERVSLWQYTNKGRVDGITQNTCDLNELKVPLSEILL